MRGDTQLWDRRRDCTRAGFTTWSFQSSGLCLGTNKAAGLRLVRARRRQPAWPSLKWLRVVLDEVGDLVERFLLNASVAVFGESTAIVGRHGVTTIDHTGLLVSRGDCIEQGQRVCRCADATSIVLVPHDQSGHIDIGNKVVEDCEVPCRIRNPGEIGPR